MKTTAIAFLALLAIAGCRREDVRDVTIQMRGLAESDIPAVVVPADIVSVNTDTLAALGLALPEEVLAMGEIQYISSAQ